MISSEILFCEVPLKVFFGSDRPMTQHVEFSEEFLTKVAKDNRVSDGELAALKLALDQQKSKDIAKYLNISEAAARKRLGEVYKKFHIKGNGPGKLASLKQQLVDSSTGLLYKAETPSLIHI